MTSKLSGLLPLSPLLSDVAQRAFVLDDLRTGTLVSLAQICDDDCTAIFSKKDVKIVKNQKIIITGTRTPNGLWSIPLHTANHQAGTLRTAWESTHQHLIHQGHPPQLHVLDNECSDDLKKAFIKYNVQFQRVPPKEHRVNAAERAIRTFKNHFVATLSSVDSRFPLELWDRLLPQTTLTLNLLRSSRSALSLKWN